MTRWFRLFGVDDEGVLHGPQALGPAGRHPGPGPLLEAHCIYEATHVPPVESCTCGVYAVADALTLRWIACLNPSRLLPDRWMGPSHVFHLMGGVRFRVTAELELDEPILPDPYSWATVNVTGVRARRARMVRLRLSSVERSVDMPAIRATASQLRERYGVPVNLSLTPDRVSGGIVLDDDMEAWIKQGDTSWRRWMDRT